MNLAPGVAQTVRAAQQVIARRAQARQAPAVLWTSLDEAPEAFAARCERVQAPRVLAAVPYGYAVPAGVQAVPFPPKLFKLLHPTRPSRYRAVDGGRGSAKSHSVATALVLKAFTHRLRILCAREIQRSLRESVHHLLTDKIDTLGLPSYFDVNDREIACRSTGTEIIFAGLSTNVQQLKSLEAIGLVWLEEAESISARSFEILPPTIRAPGSEIWITWNQDDPDAPVQQFADGTRPDTHHEHLTFADNPWFPAELEAERAYLARVDDDSYRHVWLGECRTHSEAQVFRKKYVVEAFEACAWGWAGPYFGLDFGFSQDPTAGVLCWVYERTLYISHEVYQIGCDIDRTPALLDELPNARRHVIRADSARPETISYLRHNGYAKVQPATKWKGCVEDGVAHLRSYERIVLHPRCVHTIEEMRLYQYKVDRLTGDVLADLVDRNNHCIDALRYALEPMMRGRRSPYVLGTL